MNEQLPERITSTEQLDELLSRPTPYVVEALRAIPGDILVLGVAGKMGPTLARMARRAATEADGSAKARRVIGVARFSNPAQQAEQEKHGIETIKADLLDMKSKLARAPGVAR